MLMAVTLMGCGGVRSTMTNPSPRELEARKPAEVEVYLVKTPDRPFQEVAIIESSGPDKSVEDIRRKAAQVGCDAVLVRDGGQAVTGNGWMFASLGIMSASSSPTYRAACVVFLDAPKTPPADPPKNPSKPK
jgi:hypothetical protein